MPSVLKLYLLGPFHAERDGAPLTTFESDKARVLLAYLALESGFPARRDVLTEQFWPGLEQKAQRHNLSQALLSLRRTLRESEKTPFFRADRQTVQFVAPDVWIDVQAFETLLAACQTHGHARPEQCAECAGRRAEAIALYRDDFLAGLSLDAGASFDDWATLRRERSHRLAIDALHWLAAYHETRGEFAQAEGYARQQVALEPWREEAQRQLMRILAHAGQRSAALAQYATCRQVLAEELGVDPAPETTALYERIRAATEGRSFRLPVPATPFVGRRQALAALTGLLADPALRLVTINGPGGIGKTRLAIQAAQANEARFLDGVCYVPLVGLSEASQLFSAIVSALELPPGQDEPEKRLVSFLRDREILLVLDNVEHLKGADSMLVQLLEMGPDVQLLVTSRVPLNLRAETRYVLDGLAVPADTAPLETLLSYEAIQLFDQTAQRVRPGFQLADAAADVVRICQLLQGTPLALEIAATWLRLVEPEAIAAEIDRSLDFLVAEEADVPERHRSLRAVFAHSWVLLNAEDRATLARLTAFRGPFTREAAMKVAGATRFTLVSLLDRSLLRRTTSGRYAIHELIRQFAADRRFEVNAGTEVEDAHADFFLALLEEQDPVLAGPDAPRALSIIRAELDNVRQAWRWAVEAGRLEALAAGTPSLATFCHLAGLVSEGEALLAAGVARARATPSEAEPDLLLGRLLGRQAGFLVKLGDYDRAEAVADEALALVERAGNLREAAAARVTLGRIAEFKGHYDEAQASHQAALKNYRDAGMPRGTSEALNGLGNVYWRRAEFQEALAYFEEALALDRAVGNQNGAAQNLGNMGIIYKEIGQFEQSLTCLRQAMAIVELLGSEEGIARNANNLGLVYWQTGRRQEALEQYKRAAALAKKLGIKRGIAITLTNVGVINRELGAFETALDYYQQSNVVAKEIGFMPVVAMNLGNTANIYRDMGRFAEARPLYEQAIGIDEELGNREGVARQWGELGRLLALEGQDWAAIDTLERAIAIMRQLDTRYYLAILLPVLAETLLAVGETERAGQVNAEGLALARAVNRRDGLAQATIVAANLAAHQGETDAGAGMLRELLSEEDEPERQAMLAFALWQLTGDEAARTMALERYALLAERTPNATYHARRDLLLASED